MSPCRIEQVGPRSLETGRGGMRMFMCSSDRGREKRRCAGDKRCKGRVTRLCDWILSVSTLLAALLGRSALWASGPVTEAKTCDADLCAKHAVRVRKWPEIDYCPEHALALAAFCFACWTMGMQLDWGRPKLGTSSYDPGVRIT